MQILTNLGTLKILASQLVSDQSRAETYRIQIYDDVVVMGSNAMQGLTCRAWKWCLRAIHMHIQIIPVHRDLSIYIELVVGGSVADTWCRWVMAKTSSIAATHL